jgi:hypothetical protein
MVEPKTIIPDSEREFSEKVQEGDLVKVSLSYEGYDFYVYERVRETTNPNNPVDGFLRRDRKNPLRIESWQSERKYLQFGGGIEFNHLYKQLEVYTLTSPEFGKKFDLLVRAGNITLRELREVEELIKLHYTAK